MLIDEFRDFLSFRIFADGIQILWTKDDSAATIIAMGSRVIAPEYKDRATVMMDEQGSTLTIGIAKAEDRGLYKCSVAVRGDQPEVKHQVRIRGQSVSQVLVSLKSQ